MDKVLDCLKRINMKLYVTEREHRIFYTVVEQAILRLNKYEQILGNGRLTDRNYKNTTLDLDSCKPYMRLGQLEDIYEEGKKK